jgi:hypothetical protein
MLLSYILLSLYFLYKIGVGIYGVTKFTDEELKDSNQSVGGIKVTKKLLYWGFVENGLLLLMVNVLF